jgi:phage FluMu protein gp41
MEHRVEVERTVTVRLMEEQEHRVLMEEMVPVVRLVAVLPVAVVAPAAQDPMALVSLVVTGVKVLTR